MINFKNKFFPHPNVYVTRSPFICNLKMYLFSCLPSPPQVPARFQRDAVLQCGDRRRPGALCDGPPGRLQHPQPRACVARGVTCHHHPLSWGLAHSW